MIALKTKQKMDVRKTQKKVKTNNVYPMTTRNFIKNNLNIVDSEF